MANKKTSLEVKVLAINTLNEYAGKIYQYEMEHFSKFIGQSIFKVDGSIKQKYDHEKLYFKGQMPDGTYYNLDYYFRSNRSFDIHITVCVNGGSYDVRPSTAFCWYERTIFELFPIIDGQIQTSERASKIDFSKRYKVEELLELQDKAHEAAKVYEKTVDAVPYIFRDVLNIQRLTR